MSTIADDTKWIQHVHPGATGGGRYGDGDACEFDTSVTPLYEAIPLSEVPKLTSENYTPGGQTALHDALSTAIQSTDDRVETLPGTD
jgi:hypothetical protein